MNDLVSIMADKFRNHFGSEPLVVISPGRVNLIGEHTDYNEGFVLPGATDKAVVLAVSPRSDGLCQFVARDFDQEFRCELDSLHKSPLGWPDYIEGVIDQFLQAGQRIGGFNCVFGGDIPIGAGMSSSAAIEGGLAFALNRLFGLGLDNLTLVKLAQKAENEFVGVRCGIMDQFINIHGREKSVLKLDCRSLEFDHIPFDREDLRIVVCDTMVRRELAGSEYNVRRRQCEEAVGLLQQYEPAIRSLRDVSLDLLGEHEAEFDPIIYRRAKYVVEENRRVEEASTDLVRGDFSAFGERMKASHEGLRDGYEVSSVELDALVEAAGAVPGVLGARMMGAGFGGCTINLVEADAVFEFRTRVSASYEAVFEKAPAVHVIRIEAGTRIAPVA
jgi:galactokinase